MGERESSELVGAVGTQMSAPSSPAWHSGSWWSHRHFHVPVVVWIVASVLGGAAIGSAVEPDHKANETPTTIEITSEQGDASACDPKSANVAGDANRPSFAAGSADVVGVGVDGDDADALDSNHDGIACD